MHALLLATLLATVVLGNDQSHGRRAADVGLPAGHRSCEREGYTLTLAEGIVDGERSGDRIVIERR